MKKYNIYFQDAHQGLGAYLLSPSSEGRLSNENTHPDGYWKGTLEEAERLIEARGWAQAEIVSAHHCNGVWVVQL